MDYLSLIHSFGGTTDVLEVRQGWLYQQAESVGVHGGAGRPPFFG
jgi:hypothetical protein